MGTITLTCVRYTRQRSVHLRRVVDSRTQISLEVRTTFGLGIIFLGTSGVRPLKNKILVSIYNRLKNRSRAVPNEPSLRITAP